MKMPKPLRNNEKNNLYPANETAGFLHAFTNGRTEVKHSEMHHFIDTGCVEWYDLVIPFRR